MTAGKLAVLALAIFGSAQAAVAQDPVKLSPHLYKVLLENDQVRVLEFRVKPGDKEPMHSHPAAVVYVFADGKAKATTPDGNSVIIDGKAGQTVWSEPVSHSWEHIGPGNGHVLIIEMKKVASAPPPAKKP